MAKLIKRVGIVILMIVVTCLLLISSMLVINVTEDSNKIASADSQINISTEERDKLSDNSSESYDLPEVYGEYYLSGNCDQMATGWNMAVEESLDKGKNIKVTLMNDWLAKDSNETSITTFGNACSGISAGGNLMVPYGANITLDLNGFTIDRRLTKDTANETGNIIRIYGEFSLMDNKYDAKIIQSIYDKIESSSDDFEIKQIKLTEEISNIKNMGKLIGGARGLFSGGAIIGDAYAKINIYGGIVAKNFANVSGGAIATVSTQNSEINIYDGAFVGNCSNEYAGGIHAICNLNIYGGFLLSSKSKEIGGICINGIGNLNIYDCLIAYNSDEVDSNVQNINRQGGGVYYQHSSGEVNIYGGRINNNKSGSRGGGVYISSAKSFNIYGGEVCGNIAESNGGGLYPWRTTLNMHDGKVNNNYSGHEGGGIFASNGAITNIYGGYIDGNYAKVDGGGIANNNKVNLYGGYITNNSVDTASAGGGIGYSSYSFATSTINICGGVQVYNNKNISSGAEVESDIFLLNGRVLYIESNLKGTSKIARIGIQLATNYTGAFTKRYSDYNTGNSPSIFFFANETGKIASISNNEVVLISGSSTGDVKWDWGSGYTTTEPHIEVEYKGSDYTITCDKGNFYSNNSSISQAQLKNVGTYSFYVEGNYNNTTFTFTIKPKEVEIQWDNILTYNGYVQLPRAEAKEGEIFEGDSFGISASGTVASKVGKEYFASVYYVSNSNYIVKDTDKRTMFEIVPAQLTIDVNTLNKTIVYNGKIAQLNEWYSLTAKLLGDDKNKNLDRVFNIDYSQIIPQFTKDGITLDNVINKGEYAISVKEFDANKVFSGNGNYNVTINYVNGGVLSITEANVIRASVESGYSYLVLEDDKRVTYTQKGLLHGDNDSEIERYILGNIAPNTSVKEFVNNLVYDKTQIEIYNNKNKLIYNKGVAASGITEEMLNQKYELAVGTGWYIKTSVETIYLSVLGDVTGDGRISAVDVTYLRQIANDKDVYDNLSVEKKLASLVLNVGIVTTADAEIIRNIMDNKLSINLFY